MLGNIGARFAEKARLIAQLEATISAMHQTPVGDQDVRSRERAPESNPIDLRPLERETGETVTAGRSSRPRQGEPDPVVLSVARVPLNGGQNADFVQAELLDGPLRFALKITVPGENYWRAGFVLAPENYILEGRSDVFIDQYFLFHIGRGNPAKPKEPTPLSYQAYRRGHGDVRTEFQSSGRTVFLDVAVKAGRLRVTVDRVDKPYETDLDLSYFRNLYILAWADQFGPFRVPIELDHIKPAAHV